MKKLFYSLLTVTIVLFSSCKSKPAADGEAAEAEDIYAVCIWDRASLKETPEEKGKWLESLSLGEKCEYLDETKEDNSGTKPVQYYKVRLSGGKEGWVQATLMSLNSKPAALNQNADVYSRPDLLTKTNKAFSKMDIVAVKNAEGDFVEVTGKRKDGKWVETGWIKASNVTYSDIDIAVAKFGGKALKIEDEAKKREAIKEILDNSDFSNSIFITDLYEIVNVAPVNETVDTSATIEATVEKAAE